MKRPLIRSLTVILTACLLLAASLLLVADVRAYPTEAAPAAAPAAVNGGSQVFAAFGVTQTVTGTARYLTSYTADCYATLVLTGSQGVALTLQHSPDAATWVTHSTITEVTHSGASQATSIAFSPTMQFYGTYIRAIATLTSALTGTSAPPVNVTLLCTYH